VKTARAPIAAVVLAAAVTHAIMAEAKDPTVAREEAFKEGLAAEEKGDFEKARSAYERALTADPAYGRALVNLGLIEIRHKDVEKGLAHCQRAQQIEPEAAKVQYCFGIAYLRQGKDKDAEAAFERSIAALATDPAPKIELGHLKRKAKHYEEAVQLYREAVRLNADDPDLHVHLGYCYKQLKDLKAAEVEYRKAVQKKPDSYFGHLDLGWVLAKENKDKEAEPHYLRATELNPKEADPFFNLGNLYRRMGEIQKAKTSYEKAVELSPDRPEHHFELGRVLWTLGDPTGARHHLDKALELKPSDDMKRAIDKTMKLLDTKPPARAIKDPKAGPNSPKGEEAKPPAAKTPAE
jgi:tetratricopeptide (TPR) repeat protein